MSSAPSTPTPAASAARRFDAVALAMGLAFALMWSSAFTSAKFVVADAPPFMALSARFLISGALACALAALMGQRMDLTRRQWLLVGVFGVCQNSLYLGLNFYAMTWVDAGLAAVIASLMPLMVALAGWLFLGERLRPAGALGLALGVAGVALVMGARASGAADLAGAALCLAAAAALAAATLLVRGVSPGDRVLMIVGLQMLAGAATLAPVALAFESAADLRLTAPMLAAFAYTTLVPGVLATVVWFLLVKRIGPVGAASFHFLNPGLGVLIAAVMLAEPLSWRDALGVAVAGAGILLTQTARRAPRAAA